MRTTLPLALTFLLLGACDQEVPFVGSGDADTTSPDGTNPDGIGSDTVNSNPDTAQEDAVGGPRLLITPDPVLFGNVSLALEHSREVRLTNPGPAAVTITAVTISPLTAGDIWELRALPSFPRSLAPSESLNVVLVYENLGGAPTRAELAVTLEGLNAPITAEAIAELGSSVDCSFEAACGGDPTGLWTLASSCWDFDPAVPDCADGIQSVTDSSNGALTIQSDGTFAVVMNRSVTYSITRPNACIPAHVTSCDELERHEDETCTGTPAEACTCNDTERRAYNFGGTWSTAGNILTLDNDGGDEQYQFCVNGNVLRLRHAMGIAVYTK